MFGEGFGRGIAVSEDVNADQADDRGDAIAVDAKFFESLVLDGQPPSAAGRRRFCSTSMAVPWASSSSNPAGME